MKNTSPFSLVMLAWTNINGSFRIADELKHISYCCQRHKHKLNYSCKVPDILSALNHMWSFLTDLRKIPHKFRENPSSGNGGVDYATIVGQTVMCAERYVRPFSLSYEQVYKAFSLSQDEYHMPNN